MSDDFWTDWGIFARAVGDIWWRLAIVIAFLVGTWMLVHG